MQTWEALHLHDQDTCEMLECLGSGPGGTSQSAVNPWACQQAELCQLQCTLVKSTHPQASKVMPSPIALHIAACSLLQGCMCCQQAVQ